MTRQPPHCALLFAAALAACGSAHDAPAARTLPELADRCRMSTAALDSLLASATRELRVTRGIDVPPGSFAVMLATSLPRAQPPDCPGHARHIVRTVNTGR